MTRVGKIGQDINSSWDNGFYTNCLVEGVSSKFLIDTGSTITLISKRIYDKMDPHERPQMYESTMSVHDVTGGRLHIYGQTSLTITVGNNDYAHPVTICDMSPEGILGQDFMMKFVIKIDYSRQQLHTDRDIIQCWTGGESCMVCKVLLKKETVIPAESIISVPVDIPNSEHLASTGFVYSSSNFSKPDLHLIEGLVDTRCKDQGYVIQMANKGNEPITVYPKTELGTCVSIYETIEEPEISARCAHVQSTESDELPPHLHDLVDKSSKHLDANQKKSFVNLILRYQDVFSRSSEDIGFTNKVEHRIDVGDARPIKQAPRRLPFGKRASEKEEIEKMLERGVIEPSTSPWAAPIVLVSKKDGGIRFCVDYRKLNEVTVKDAYPLPRVDECLDCLSGSKWFSTMDLNSGFWQIGLDKDSKEKTAFASSSMGLFQFTVMPFGLVGSPSTFSRLMEDVLRGLQWEECVLYMDDIISGSPTFEESLCRLEHIFQRLQSANLKLKPSKCIFFQKCVKFLGHLVSEEGVHTDPDKISAVKEWLIPKSVKQVRSFLGLCTYYRRFVQDFARIAGPLHRLCNKDVKFNWTDECQIAFDHLKQALCSAPILSYPVLGQKFILDTDASDQSTGAVLSQEQEGQEHVIAYMSKRLNSHEQSYCTTRKELLAVVQALKQFHHYLYGQKVQIRTDNAAVSWATNLKCPTGQMARWLQVISTYDLEITHRAGKKHSNADALSRAPCKVCVRQESSSTQEEANAENNNLQENRCEQIRAIGTDATLKPRSLEMPGWDVDQIRKLQLEDKDIRPVLQWKEDNKLPNYQDVGPHSSKVKTLVRQWGRLEIHDGLLYRRFACTTGEDFLQLIVAKGHVKDILLHHHDLPVAGHLGYEKTLEKIKQNYYWPGMKNSVMKYCSQCDQCAARKMVKTMRAPMGHVATGEPMECVALDIQGPLPLTLKGNRYILVIVDLFTKWTEAIALPNQEAETVAQTFVNEFITKFGTPLRVLTDQGRNFESKLFRDMCHLLQIDKARTSSAHPQTNGVVERFNRTLKCMLTMFCQDKQNTWDSYLPQLMMAYRSSVHSATGYTPNRMMLGREVNLPLQAIVARPVENHKEEDVDKYVSNLEDKLVLTHEMARENIQKAGNYQKKYYDVKSTVRSVKPGDAVWLYNPTRKVRVCSKLTPHWKGPYLVVRSIDSLTCAIKVTAKQPPKIYHIDRLMQYKGINIPKWFQLERIKLGINTPAAETANTLDQ